MKKNDLLGLNPIRFSKVHYSGKVGSFMLLIDYVLSDLTTQNILYSAYLEAKTIDEISEILGLQKSIVEEEVIFLEENGFLEIVPNTSLPLKYPSTSTEVIASSHANGTTRGGLPKSSRASTKKYLTNMLIHDFPDDILLQRHNIYSNYAKIICEKYIYHLIKKLSPIPYSLSLKIYTPQNDQNFLLWSLISYACCKKFEIPSLKKNLSKYYIKRIDGGEYFAFTSLKRDNSVGFIQEKYNYSEDINFTIDLSGFPSLSVFDFKSCFDDRPNLWYLKMSAEPGSLYLYMKNKTRTDINLQYLYELGYLRVNGNAGILPANNKNIAGKMPAFQGSGNHSLPVKMPAQSSTEYINMVITTLSQDELIDLLPPIPDDFIKLNKSISEELYNISKDYYPPQVKDLCQAFYQQSLSNNDIITRILEQLLNDGVLKPLTEIQRKTVNMIMFSDVLPG